MRFLVMAGLALTVLSISHALTLSSRVSEEQLAIANAPIAKPATAPIKKPCEPWRVYEVVMAKGEEKPEIVERPLLDTRYPKGAVWVKNEGGRGGTYYPCEKTPEDTFNSVLARRSAKEQADIAEIKRDLAKQSSQPSAPSPYPLVLSRDLFPPAADEYAPPYDPPASHAFDELQAIAAKDPPPLSPENARPLPQSPIDEEFVLAPARQQSSWDTITPDSYRPAPSSNASFSSPESEPSIDWSALQIKQGDWDWGQLAPDSVEDEDPYSAKLAQIQREFERAEQEAMFSENIDRNDAEMGAAIRDLQRAYRGAKAEQLALEREISANIDRYDAEFRQHRTVEPQNVNNNFGFPIDVDRHVDQCADTAEVRTCAQAFVAFSNARARDDVMNQGRTLLAELAPRQATIPEVPAERIPASPPDPSAYTALCVNSAVFSIVCNAYTNATQSFSSIFMPLTSGDALDISLMYQVPNADSPTRSLEQNPQVVWQELTPFESPPTGYMLAGAPSAPPDLTPSATIHDRWGELSMWPSPGLEQALRTEGENRLQLLSPDARNVPAPTLRDLWQSIAADDVRQGLGTFEQYSQGFARWVDEFFRPKPIRPQR